MAVVKFFQGRPVKRMRQTAEGILLTFYAPESGEAGPQQTVSQVEWDEHGEKLFVPDEDATAEKLRDRTRQLGVLRAG